MDQMKEMEILTIGGQDYEVVDEAARKKAENNAEAVSKLSEELAKRQPMIVRKSAPIVICKPVSNNGFNVTSVYRPNLNQTYRNKLYITGKNMYDFVNAFGGIGYTETISGVTITVQDDHALRVIGTNAGTGWVKFNAKNIIADYVFPAGDYCIPNGIDLEISNVSGVSLGKRYGNFRVDVPWKITAAYTAVEAGATVDQTIPLAIAAGRNVNLYSLPYEGWTSGYYNTPTTYGATHSYSDGVFTRTHMNYASYAGENVNGEWISSTNALENGVSITGKMFAPSVSSDTFKGEELPDVAGKECYIWSNWDQVEVDFDASSDVYKQEIEKAAKALIPDEWKTLVKLEVRGETELMTKYTEVPMLFEAFDPNTGRIVRGQLTMKWQGSSSIAFDKKNFTIESVEVFEVVDGWGAQGKYCLKANYIDHSHARNVCAAKLWGEVVKSRNVVPEGLGNLVNGGAIDGIPLLLYINGEYWGLYTWNIPKDGWMLGMPTLGATNEAIVCADGYSEATRFFGMATEDNFAIEYATDKDNAEWVIQSVNTLIQAVIDSDGTDLDTTLAQYVDWQSAIDYYIFTVLLTGADMMDKNYVMFTRDGVKWYFSAYDLDTTFGLRTDGKSFYPATSNPTFAQFAEYHKLMGLIKAYKKDELKARYNQLRAGVLSESNVAYVFSNFIGSIPTPVYDSDVERWPSIPSSAASNLAQIVTQYNMRCAIIDKEIDAM